MEEEEEEEGIFLGLDGKNTSRFDKNEGLHIG